jgi:predicted MFS family arabinose efflux permease
LAFSNQLCGINAILFYSWQIFMKITDKNKNLCQMLVLLLGIAQFVSSFIGGMMIDQTNKKYFLLSGEFLMACCLYSIFRLEQYEVMVILLIFCHTIVYSFGVGQLLVYYGGIMIKNTSIIVLTNWIATFLVALCA